MKNYIKRINEISIKDIVAVGGKNASLGEMRTKVTLPVENVIENK